MTDCIRTGCNRKLPPVEIFQQINGILLEFDKRVADAGWTGDLALDAHKGLVAIYSDVVTAIACYEGSLTDAEAALIEHIASDLTHCLNEELLPHGINPAFKPELQAALSSLYRRGLLRRDEQTGFVKLTSAGMFYVDSD